jgi:hypothetical protein
MFASSISDKETLYIKVYAKRYFPIPDNFMGELPLSVESLHIINNSGTKTGKIDVIHKLSIIMSISQQR